MFCITVFLSFLLFSIKLYYFIIYYNVTYQVLTLLKMLLILSIENSQL